MDVCIPHLPIEELGTGASFVGSDSAKHISITGRAVLV